jgi:hypothetical protein
VQLVFYCTQFLTLWFDLYLSENPERENRNMTRKEEPTKATTPDKIDRSLHDDEVRTGDGDMNPYPLTEEEPTPNTPKSEQVFEKESEEEGSPRNSSGSRESKKNEKGKVSEDYNKLVSH